MWNLKKQWFPSVPGHRRISGPHRKHEMHGRAYLRVCPFVCVPLPLSCSSCMHTTHPFGSPLILYGRCPGVCGPRSIQTRVGLLDTPMMLTQPGTASSFVARGRADADSPDPSAAHFPTSSVRN